NFRLVWRVLGVPARVLEDGALDDGRRNRVVVAHADHRAQHAILIGVAAQFRERLEFAARWVELKRLFDADAARHGLIDELIERTQAERGQHALDFGVARADMPVNKAVVASGNARIHVVHSEPNSLAAPVKRNGDCSNWMASAARAEIDPG